MNWLDKGMQMAARVFLLSMAILYFTAFPAAAADGAIRGAYLIAASIVSAALGSEALREKP